MEQWHSRGYLPHFDIDMTPQFVTYREAESLPLEALNRWRNELRLATSNDRKQEIRRCIER